MTKVRLVDNSWQDSEEEEKEKKPEVIPLQAVVYRPHDRERFLANTGRPRFIPPPTLCHVCGRTECSLASHKNYIFPEDVAKPIFQLPSPKSRRRGRENRSRMEALALQPVQLLEIRTRGFDPFINLPIREGERDNDLFQHFFNISSPRMMTATGRNVTQNIMTAKILPVALQNPAACQGAIAYAAAQVANISGRVAPDQKDLMVYQKSLRLLYEAMKEDPTRFKDVLIFPAVTIAGFDLTYGRKDEFRRHLDSIYRIVKSTGGLHSLGLGGVGAHILLWLDCFGAIFLNRTPLFDLPSRPDITLPGPPHIYGTAFEEMLQRRTMDEKVLQACIQSCRLTELLEKITNDPGPSRESEYFAFKRNQVTHQLAVVNGDHLMTLDRTTCVCRAAVTLQFWTLHNSCDTHAIFHHLGIELQKALLATDLVSFWGDDIDLLQWILFTAGSLMHNRSGGRWYQQFARQTLVKQYGDQWPLNWKDLQKQNIRRYLWSEMFLERPFQSFCGKISKLLEEGD